MLLLWIFAGVLAGIKSQVCPNSTVYNGCGESLQSNITSVQNQNALTFEALNYICGSGSDTVKCFLNGLRDCPNSNLTFQSGFTLQQWNVSQIGQLLASGCQTPESKAFMSNYGCIKTSIESPNYNTCLSQAIAANPFGVNMLISCGLQTQGKSCITTYIGTGCNNQTALDFFLQWYFIKGNFEPNCSNKSQVCRNSTAYNGCGESLQSAISSVQNQNALTFEALNYICGSGNYIVKCFLNGLRDCPNSNLTFQLGFTLQQWNVSLIGQLLASGCQTPESQAFMSNYGCIKTNIESSNYNTCLSQAIAANPLGVNSSISCGLQTQGKSCITTYIGTGCNNQTALDFFLQWYFIKGNFEPNCSNKSQVCRNSTAYNGCGESLQSAISSVQNQNALTFEALNYICGSGNYIVKCFLNGLRDCPNSNLTFQLGFTLQQWNVSLIGQLLASGCQTPESQAFMSNYGCIKTNIESSNYNTCLSQAIAANPLGVNSSISCGLQTQGKSCITTYIGTGCNNQTALDFFLQWYFIKGNFEPNCSNKSQVCPNSTVYNGCGESLQRALSSVQNQNALTFEALNYICGSGNYIVKCFLNGLRDCPNSNLTFQLGFALQQWNVSLIRQLLASGCQTPESQAFMSNYECIKTNIESSNYNTCLSQAIAANPLSVNSSISCGLQRQGKSCINTHIGANCNNQTALDFFLKWSYIQGNFVPYCGTVNGVESLKMFGTFPLVVTIYIFLMLLM